MEYKSIWKDEYIKWISGFANAQKGKGDSSNIVGIRTPIRYRKICLINTTV